MSASSRRGVTVCPLCAVIVMSGGVCTSTEYHDRDDQKPFRGPEPGAGGGTPPPGAAPAIPPSSIRWTLLSHDRAIREPTHACSAAVRARQTVRLFFPRWTSSEWRGGARGERARIPAA